MAKRKRLSPAALTGGTEMPADLETKARDGWVGVRPRTPRAPIAKVSGDAATRSAFEEVASELQAARAEGRMVAKLPLSSIEAGHLVRDRLAMDDEDMAVLTASLRDRGQQTPIEVVELGAGRYGLISGWRRLMALRALQEESTEAERFGHVHALIRNPEDAAAAYRAMVEENEVRANLSFYERARIAVKAAEEGVHPNPKTAVQALFAAARAPKRSKIVAFTELVAALDDVLRFPAAIPEKLGLALVAALQADTGARRRLQEALRKADPQDPATERQVLEQALSEQGTRPAAREAVARSAEEGAEELAPGIRLAAGRKRIVLSGAAVDADLLEDLRAWIVARRS
jgi:ParB family chromosome partitioning protein